MTSGTHGHRRIRTRWGIGLAPLAAAVALLAGSPARAQTTEKLGTEALRAELLQTREELRTAQALIETLRAEVARLSMALREAADGPALEAIADLPADPLACPASLTAELARRYARDLAHLPNASPRDGFERAATDWCEQMHHEIQGRRDWLVSLTDMTPVPGSRDLAAVMRVYDEVVLLPYGEPERVVVPARFVTRLRAEPAARLWAATLEVSAEPVYNPTRDARGPFNEPPFVGPFVESGYHLEWIGLTPTTLAPTPTEPENPAPLPPPPPPGPER